MAYIGCSISLITKSEIRYTGTGCQKAVDTVWRASGRAPTLRCLFCGTT